MWCLVLFRVLVAAAIVEESAWDLAYRLSCRTNPESCSEAQLRETQRFLDFSRYGFVPVEDPRVEELKKIKPSHPSPSPEPASSPVPASPVMDVAKRPVLRLAPVKKKSVRGLLRQAQEAVDNGRFDEAERLLKRARRWAPDSADVAEEWKRLQRRMEPGP